MSEITRIAVLETLNFISSSIKSAKVTIDGVERDFPIYKTRQREDTVRKYIYLDAKVQGLVTKAVLVDSQGREWFVREHTHDKKQQGYVIVFPIRQSVGSDVTLDDLEARYT